MISHFVTHGTRPDLNDMGPGVPQKLKELVESCWAQEVKHRPAVHGQYASCKNKERNLARKWVALGATKNNNTRMLVFKLWCHCLHHSLVQMVLFGYEHMDYM